MKYRIDLDADGNIIHIPVSGDAVGRTVYDVDTGSDGGLNYTPTVVKEEPPVSTCQSNNLN